VRWRRVRHILHGHTLLKAVQDMFTSLLRAFEMDGDFNLFCNETATNFFLMQKN
jgi:hypothetical protein